MRIHSIGVQNFRPFKVLEEVKLGRLATIVGQNDTGKSSILKALQIFFSDKPKLNSDDIYDHAGSNDDMQIEVAFDLLPDTINLEKDIPTTLAEEMLLDTEGHLRVKKTYPRTDLSKANISLVTYDFEADDFAGLAARKEKELNDLSTSFGLEVKKSGRSITNKGKREQLRVKAKADGIPLIQRELLLTAKDDLWKSVSLSLPEFILFESDTRLGVGETSFQSQFRPMLKAVQEEPDVISATNALMGLIAQVLQDEVDKIFQRLRRHTSAFVGLTAKPAFSLDKAVSFDILGKDEHGINKSLDLRGTGMRRLMMVAFFQYLAQRDRSAADNFVFGVEEPENCLHPGLQHELVRSFRELADEGLQIIITSHSPVFAGSSPIGDLALIVREKGVARGIQTPELELEKVADELGVEPADQISAYSACVFVEGPGDIQFFKAVATKLKQDNHISSHFDDKRIGFIPFGGDNLKHWIDLEAMHHLNRHYGVVVDSDRKSASHNVPSRKLNWKKKCEENGGRFFILRKRSIENYLHPKALDRQDYPQKEYDDFTDMKQAFGDKIFKVIHEMTAEEILEMDVFTQDGAKKHELKEITEAFLSLA